MVFNDQAAEPTPLYVDELTLSAAISLAQFKGLRHIIVLDKIKRRQGIWKWALESFSIRVDEAQFFAGHVKTNEGESPHLSARRTAGLIALEAAKEIVDADPELYRLNEEYKRNIIQMFMAKLLFPQVEYWTSRALVAQALSKRKGAKIWMKKPTLFNEEFLRKALTGIELLFYPSVRLWLLDFLVTLTLDFARDVKLRFVPKKRRMAFQLSAKAKPSLLMLQEDNFLVDPSFRGQPHWLDIGLPPEGFDTYVVELFGWENSVPEDISRLSQARVVVLPTSAFRNAARFGRSHKTLQRLRTNKRRVRKRILSTRDHKGRFFLLKVASFLRQAELMGALACMLNTKVFLVRETYYSFSDAMQLIAPQLNVTTIAYQYSNMPFILPPMLCTADKCLVFSEMYKALFHSNGISPKEFVISGYLYDGVSKLVGDRALKRRKALEEAGAEFVLCYFDESVQSDRWGLVSKEQHLSEVHALVSVVLSDLKVGVVVKSQFRKNAPSRLYPEDERIKAALATGRYVELTEGRHRNNIFPTEAALVADMVIGHKFGATAALEAAIAGARTVLLDPYGTKTFWDSIYARVDIEFQSIESALNAITAYKNGQEGKKSLGDWAAVLDFFDPYRDGQAVDRMRAEIRRCFADYP